MELKKGTVLNGIYRVKKLLGKGAMGYAYLVEKISNNKEFVVKELKFTSETHLDQASAKEIFFREAEFIAKFDHRGLPKMYGIFTHNDQDYLTLEYIKGKTLEKIINKSRKPLSVEKALTWVIEIAEIFHYLHYSFETPIVYRDLKPSNIMITEEKKVKIIDFGISRYYKPGQNTDTFRLGSPGYAAPEQYKGRGQSSPQSDIFALGVILFQMVTKYDPTLTPFKFPDIKSLNPSITDELASITMKAIELDAKKRYKNIMEFKNSLEKYTRDNIVNTPKSDILSESNIVKKDIKQISTGEKNPGKNKNKLLKENYVAKSVKKSRTTDYVIVIVFLILMGIALIIALCTILRFDQVIMLFCFIMYISFILYYKAIIKKDKND
jgi:serine/threonine-protein kinase